MALEWYRRLEPFPPYGDLGRGFAAEVADPAWFLARQWRMGEHLAEDAGAPAAVTMTAAHVPLDDHAGLDPTVVPGEAILEGTAEDWWTVGRRIRVGRAVGARLTPEQRRRVAFTSALPAPYDAAFIGQVDGLAAWRAGLIPPNHPAVGGLREAVGEEDRDAWMPSTLDHAAQFGVGGTTLKVEGHRGGEVDWYTVDGDGAAPLSPPAEGVGAPQTREVLPLRLQYPGAPHPRFWQIEGSAVDVGGFPPDRAHLATALLIELVADHANDWFLVPVPAALPPRLDAQRTLGDPPGVGVVVRIERAQARDTFDDPWELEPPADWSLYRTAGLDPSALVVWPTAATPLTGEALDDVVFGVDEDANVVWAVEMRVDGVELAADATSTAAMRDGRRTGSRAFTWLPSTTVPDHWHPYRIEPVPTEGGAARRAFVQGLVSTATGEEAEPGERRGPRTPLLGGVSDDQVAAGQDPAGAGHLLDPVAVPTHGMRLQRRYLLARGTDGRPVLWRERRTRPLLGGPQSHLRFDVLREEPVPAEES